MSMYAESISYGALFADIINCSWGGGGYSPIIIDAVQWAVEHGRGGLGCVVVSSAGNNGTESISPPASYPVTIAVGGSGRDDLRVPYSNLGSELDLVSPTAKRYDGLWITDREGTGGYNESFGWQQISRQVASGVHTLAWEFAQGGSMSDAGWASGGQLDDRRQPRRPDQRG